MTDKIPVGKTHTALQVHGMVANIEQGVRLQLGGDRLSEDYLRQLRDMAWNVAKYLEDERVAQSKFEYVADLVTQVNTDIEEFEKGTYLEE